MTARLIDLDEPPTDAPVLWRVPALPRIAHIALSTSAACVVALTGDLRCHDRATGRVLQDAHICDGCRMYMHAHDELILRVSASATQAFEPTSGRVAFQRTGRFDPVGRWGRDLLLQQGCTFIRQRLDGSEAWRVELGGRHCLPHLTTDTAAFVGRCRHDGCDAGGERIDAQTGAVRTFVVPERDISVAGSGVLVLQESGLARAWDVENGWERWRRQLAAREMVQSSRDGTLWIARLRGDRYQPIDAGTGADLGPPFAVAAEGVEGTLIGAPYPSTNGAVETQVRLVLPTGETIAAFARFDNCGPPRLAQIEGHCFARDGIAFCLINDEILAVRTAAETR